MKKNKMVQRVMNYSGNDLTREQWIDNFTDFLKKDVLGQVAFLHMKVADLDRDNIHREDWKILAKMHGLAVDNLKSDKQVNFQTFMKLKKQYDILVDFMYFEKDPPQHKYVVQSPGILGTLFRDIKNGIDREELYEIEYVIKIAKEYDLDPLLYEIPEIFSHLEFMYSEIVLPFSQEIRALMVENNLVSEGDLFNSTCEFSSLWWRRDDAFELQKEISIIFEEMKEKYLEVIKEYQNNNFEDEGKYQSEIIYRW